MKEADDFIYDYYEIWTVPFFYDVASHNLASVIIVYEKHILSACLEPLSGRYFGRRALNTLHLSYTINKYFLGAGCFWC